MKHKLILISIIFLGLTIRLVALTKYPTGFTQDEAGIGYDAYSIMLTGKDQWGVRLPLVLRSFGDFKMPLYSYLAIPSIVFFDLNEFAVRLPSVIIGTLAIVATYIMVSQYSKRKDLALWSALLLAVSPWHISLSRGAFEANLTVFFMSLGVYGFLKGLRDARWMLIASIAFGLNMFSYHSARLVTPLVLLLLLFFNKEEIFGKDFMLDKLTRVLRKYKWSLLLFLIFALTAFSTMLFGASTRGLDITIFNPTDKWAAVSQRRFEAINLGLPKDIARLYSNKVTYLVKIFTTNFVSYLSPNFLFLKGAGGWDYGMISGRGVLYLFEIVTISAGLVAFTREKNFKKVGFFVLWIILSVLPAAISKGNNSGTRAAGMVPAIQVVSAFGIVYLSDKLSQFVKLKNIRTTYNFGMVLLILFSFSFFLEDYVYHAPIQASEAMRSGYKDMITEIISLQDQYDEIVVSRTLSVPNIWFEFYGKMDPKDVQKASRVWLKYEDQGVLYIDQMDEYRLGKYIFGDIKPNELRGERNILIVGKLEEFPKNTPTLDTFYYSNNTPSYVMVESNQL